MNRRCYDVSFAFPNKFTLSWEGGRPHGGPCLGGRGRALACNRPRHGVSPLKRDQAYPGELGPTDRRTGRLPVEIPPEDAKTDQPYMAELRPRTVKLLGTFVERWRPLLGRADLPYLFPLMGLDDERGEQIALARFAARLCRLVKEDLTHLLNIHALRGLTATLYAEANPGDILTAKVKLGHGTRGQLSAIISTSSRRIRFSFRRPGGPLVEHCEPPQVRPRLEAVPMSSDRPLRRPLLRVAEVRLFQIPWKAARTADRRCSNPTPLAGHCRPTVGASRRKGSANC